MEVSGVGKLGRIRNHTSNPVEICVPPKRLTLPWTKSLNFDLGIILRNRDRKCHYLV